MLELTLPTLLLLLAGMPATMGLGLCHRRCEARFAGQLKTLSHSGHLYSTCTIMEHLPGGKKKKISVNDSSDHLHA